MDLEQNEPKAIVTQYKRDLTGQRFGKLTVLRKTEQRYNRSVLWECLCDCGNTCLKPATQLKAGSARSCGCAWRQRAVQEGQRFGKLTAIRPTDKRSAKSVVWECRCDCGNMVEVRSTMLTSGHTTSCGCNKREADAERDFKKILNYTDDTCIEFAENIAQPRSSTSPETGVRGVIRVKDGKYRARLYFRKQRYELGYFERLEDAIDARRRAEVMVQEYIESNLKK